jgi:cellobiose PTS system EIIA component
MEMTLQELEQLCMEMISYAGEGRGLVHEAVEAFAAGDLADCQQKLDEAQQALVQAHKVQFHKFLKPQTEGVQIPFHLLIIHAMDLVMISTSEMDIAKKMLTGALRNKVSQ